MSHRTFGTIYNMFRLVFCLLLVLTPLSSAVSQEEDYIEEDDTILEEETYDPDEELLEEGYTGTLAEDDPDNEARLILEEDDEEFEEENEEYLEDELEDNLPSHLIKVQFNSTVQFTEWEMTEEGPKALSSPYLEILYQHNCEIPINLGKRKKRVKSECDFEVDLSGHLASNDLFECKLDIAIEKIPVELSCKVKENKIEDKENPDEEALVEKQLACSLKFSKEAKENWYSNCVDFTSGATLNTEGDTESYNLEVLNRIEPSLRSLLIENYDPKSEYSLILETAPEIIEDIELANDVYLYGEGNISIEENF